MKFDVNCSIMFNEAPLLERPAAARNAGFDAVEYWWPFPRAVPSATDVDRFVTAVSNSGVQLVSLNLYGGDLAAGDRGILSWPERSGEFADNLEVAAEIGERLGCTVFNALYGRRLPGVDESVQDAVALERLSIAADRVAGFGGGLVLEPLSGVDDYPLRTAGQVIDLISSVDAPNIRLLADLYHLSVNGDDVPRLIERATTWIGHVQIADAPGRGQPGSGNLPIDDYLRLLEAVAYTGHVGLEYVPTGTTEESLDWWRSRQSWAAGSFSDSDVEA